MKKKVFTAILVTASLLLSFPATVSAEILAPFSTEILAAKSNTTSNLKKKHPKKGFKKPKKKKFLGVFKRKSSCDCPKH